MRGACVASGPPVVTILIWWPFLWVACGWRCLVIGAPCGTRFARFRFLNPRWICLEDVQGPCQAGCYCLAGSQTQCPNNCGLGAYCPYVPVFDCPAAALGTLTFVALFCGSFLKVLVAVASCKLWCSLSARLPQPGAFTIVSHLHLSVR